MSMGQSSGLDTGFVLGDWEVRSRHGTLRRLSTPDAEPVQLEPRVMAVLVCLARRAGQVVTRDEFIAEVWGGRIVSDEALSRCISMLRQTFGDDAHEPRYIRTVAKVGYTLLGTPQPLPSEAPGLAPVAPVATAAAGPATIAPPLPRRIGLRHFLIGGAVALTVASGLALYLLRRESPAAGPPPVTRLGVLPFDTREARDFGRDIGSELADEITRALAGVDQLRISGRTSADAIKARQLDPIEAGRRLGVDALLDGAVAQSAAGLRVSAKLVSTSNGQVQWSDVYEVKPAEIFAVQSRIATAVVRELVPVQPHELAPAVPTVVPDTHDLPAYRLYLRAAHQLRLRGEDSLRLAIELFAQAARRDPGFARADVGLANAYALLPAYSSEEPKEMWALADQALAAAEKAGGARSMSAGVRAYLAYQRWQWIDAEAAFRSALSAEPRNPDVRQLYSQLLGSVGRLDEALKQAKLALDYDPLAPVIADRLGVLYLWRGEDIEAEHMVEQARELGLEEAAYPETKVILRLHQHADAAAIEMLRDLQRTLNRPENLIEPMIRAIRHPEQRPAAIAMLEKAQKDGAISPRIYFGAMVLFESPARALRAFEALIDRDPNDVEFLFSSDAATVRSDAAFGPFVEKIGLVAYWDRYGWPRACRREGSRIACH